MSAAAGPASRTELVVLKHPDFGCSTGALPYRVDHLRALGFEPVWDDRRNHLRGWPGRIVGRTEALATPWLQTWYLRGRIRRAPATLAFFESEGHALALARVLGVGRRRTFVIMSCWLADLAPGLGRLRRAMYRRLYRRVDTVTVFSQNQVAILHEELDIPTPRIKVIPFGIDVDEVRALTPSDEGFLVAVGRDAARDWPTLFAGVADCGHRVVVLARPSRLEGSQPPANVEVLGYVERPRYLELLAACSGVLIITRDAAYPSGQTVLLEALALGKRSIVTDTAAMRSFGADLPVTWVPAGDVPALRRAITDLETTPVPVVERDRLDAEPMWAAVAAIVRDAQVRHA